MTTRGNAGKGRPKGSRNKTTTALKEAVLEAARLHGSDGNGTDELVGYCRMVAAKDHKAFTSLLGRVLPLSVKGDIEEGGPVSYKVTISFE